MLQSLLIHVRPIRLDLAVLEDRLAGKGKPLLAGLLHGLFRRFRQVFHPQIWHAAVSPVLLVADPVNDPVDGLPSHSVHGDLASGLLREVYRLLQALIRINRHAALLGAQIRLPQPGGLAADAPVANQLQAGDPNLLLPVHDVGRDRKVRIIHKVVPHIIERHSLAESSLDCFRIILEITAFMQVPHIRHSDDPLRDQQIPQIRQRTDQFLFCLDRHIRQDKISGVFPQYPCGLSLRVPVDASAGRIRRVFRDAGDLQRLAVDAADVLTAADEEDRKISASLIQIIPVWRTLFLVFSLIVAPAADPRKTAFCSASCCASFCVVCITALRRAYLFCFLCNGFRQLADRVDPRRQTGDLPAVFRQHHGMHMRIYKTGDHRPPL